MDAATADAVEVLATTEFFLVGRDNHNMVHTSPRCKNGVRIGIDEVVRCKKGFCRLCSSHLHMFGGRDNFTVVVNAVNVPLVVNGHNTAHFNFLSGDEPVSAAAPLHTARAAPLHTAHAAPLHPTAPLHTARAAPLHPAATRPAHADHGADMAWDQVRLLHAENERLLAENAALQADLAALRAELAVRSSTSSDGRSSASRSQPRSVPHTASSPAASRSSAGSLPSAPPAPGDVAYHALAPLAPAPFRGSVAPSTPHSAVGGDFGLAAEAPEDEVVFRTRTGRLYHISTCQHLRGGAIACALSDAQEMNLTPCRCMD